MLNSTSNIEIQDVLCRLERCEHRQRAIGGLLLATIAAAAIFSTRVPAISQTPMQLQAEITAIQNTLKYVTTTGTDMVISGANLHIVNGTADTATTNGLGNLIVGYNEKRNDTPNTDVRTGSHNLILGSANSYSSYSGIIAGRHNTITGNFACVQGGFGSTASGAYANVCGGNGNIASNTYSFVGGGEVNTASGLASSVTGGQGNKATAQSSAVGGGNGNTASGQYANIGGGYENTASGPYSFIGGGQGDTTAGSASSITGGNGNKATVADSTIVGGQSNIANGIYSTILGGKSNTSTTQYEIVPLSTNTVVNGELAAINTSIGGINTSITGIDTALTNEASAISILQASSTTYNTEISALLATTKYITTGKDNSGYPATFITGCNVWVQDGSGSTNDGGGMPTGLGNLIVGYNEVGAGVNTNGDIRTGSHNLIVGYANDYNSVGGEVFGFANSILDAYASVTGGSGNTASGPSASVSGGSGCVSSGYITSISGGDSNTASGPHASVSGGQANTASGAFASVAGGYFNQATGFNSSIVGGSGNKVIDDPNSPGGAESYGAILGGMSISLSTEYGHYP
jgi:hypothetical protein